MTLSILLIALALALGAINGANDNSKGAATLIGSGLMSSRSAIALATASTALGGLASILLAQGLLAAFSGKGIVPAELTVSLPFLIAVAAAATLTVGVATLASLPISTTHALFGGLIGAGLAHGGAEVDFGVAGKVIGIPLLLSPVIAVVLALGLAPLLRRIVRPSVAIVEAPCACVDLVPTTQGDTAVSATLRLSLGDAASEACQPGPGRTAVPLLALRGADLLHLLSAAVVGFARGMNDTPKIAALLVAAGIGSVGFASSGIVIAMAVGGLLGAHRVANTLSWKVTGMDPREGLAGNLVTSTLVILASRFGLPVSTTHVGTGALFGIGVSNGQGKPRMILTILLAWGVTLPLSATLAALFHTLLPSH